MKAGNKVYSLFALITQILVIAVSGCTTPNEEIHYLGDLVHVGPDMTMVLASADFRNDLLEASFTIKNNGSEEMGYNLWLSFQARDTEGNSLPQVIPCGSALDGSLQPGEEATGAICWDTENTEIVRIHYLVILFETKHVWEVEK